MPRSPLRPCKEERSVPAPGTSCLEMEEISMGKKIRKANLLASSKVPRQNRLLHPKTDHEDNLSIY